MASPTIEARVDSSTRKAIEAFREDSGFDSMAQSVRVLIGLGLQAASENPDLKGEMRRLMYREAYIEIARMVRKSLGDVQQTLIEYEENVRGD